MQSSDTELDTCQIAGESGTKIHPNYPSQSTTAEDKKATKLAKRKRDSSPGSSSSLRHSETQQMMVKRLSQDAKLPVRASEHAAGYDLFAAKAASIPARGRLVIPTDVAISLPPSTYGRIAPRSGLAVKHGIDVGAGVIDEDYTGNIMVLLFNHSDEPFIVNKWDRIAQLIVTCIACPLICETEEIDQTKRGDSGFGSTGK
jgi:dUTP pyrophosphatase